MVWKRVAFERKKLAGKTAPNEKRAALELRAFPRYNRD